MSTDRSSYHTDRIIYHTDRSSYHTDISNTDRSNADRSSYHTDRSSYHTDRTRDKAGRMIHVCRQWAQAGGGRESELGQRG
jgi:hypothetical protein